jgi:transcriptional regulator with XRE-family HTH domain
VLNLDLAVRQRRWLLKSQREMAADLGVSERTFNRWENGHITPSVDDLKQWAAVLEVPLPELITAPEPEIAS